MPRLIKALPKYRKHRSSGQAVVNLSGVDHYLGPHGTKTSRLEYDRLVAEWLQNGRQLRPAAECSLTVVEVMAAYVRHARGYYRKGDRLTSEYAGIIYSLRILKELYGRVPVAEFGPLSLQTVRQKMIEAGSSRGVVNQNVGRIRRMFKWAAAEELIPAGVPQALSMVAGLRQGRTAARETAPVPPVDDATVDATLPYLPTIVADMVRLQRLTGMRPAEVCILRPCDLDRSGDVWTYTPESHKTQHHGRSRVVFIGPKGQAVLLRYLARDPLTYCFRPCDSEAKRRAAQHEARVTPLSCGNRLDVTAKTASFYGELIGKIWINHPPPTAKTRTDDHLVKLGVDINDIWIAAQSIEHNLRLVTSDNMACIKEAAEGLLSDSERWTV